MFLFSLLNVLYGFMCVMIVLLVLIQRGKSSMGLGNMGGSNQMLFGSSGGQDIFQKTTWVLCALLLSGALFLAVLKGKEVNRSVGYSKVAKEKATRPTGEPTMPSKKDNA